MTLQNSAQNKEFGTANSPQNRQVKTREFVWHEKTNTKTFPEPRKLPSRQFQTRSFNRSKDAASVNTKTAPQSDLVFETHMATGVRNVADGGKKVSTRDFAGNRPFLGRGKSQKALSQRDRPLTIEEVRELLNKNK